MQQIEMRDSHNSCATPQRLFLGAVSRASAINRERGMVSRAAGHPATIRSGRAAVPTTNLPSPRFLDDGNANHLRRVCWRRASKLIGIA